MCESHGGGRPTGRGAGAGGGGRGRAGAGGEGGGITALPTVHSD